MNGGTMLSEMMLIILMITRRIVFINKINIQMTLIQLKMTVYEGY